MSIIFVANILASKLRLRRYGTLSDPFKFVYVSGEGADPTERTFTLFGKIKGRAENDLHALSASTPSLRTFALRPGVIDPEGELLRDRPRRLVEVIVAPVFRRVWTAGIIGTKPLARVLTDIASGDGSAMSKDLVGVEAEGKTLANVGIRRLAGV